ncbi:MAG: hypothetical protein ACM3JD_00950 [Rudaea sp.]
MELLRHDGVIVITAATYNLTLPVDRPFVYVSDASGFRLLELFVLSSVHPLHGRDDTTAIGKWQVRESDQEICLSLEAESSVWPHKIFRFRCTPRRFTYEIEVQGRGALAEANYFGGYYSGELRWGSGFFWSGQNFRQGFNPEPNTEEINHFLPESETSIDLTGVPLPGRGGWFFTPPPFSFAFHARNEWLGLGVQAPQGEKRFTEFSYHGRRGGFYLSLSYEGHTVVDNSFQLPAIGFDFGTDELDVLSAHVRSLAEIDYLPHRNGHVRPEWWRQPIFCGWGEQANLAARENGKVPAFSTQKNYEGFLETLERNGVKPGTVTIDDKWQSTYGRNEVDTYKWPDLPGFVARQHGAGRKLLLWFKAWDCEGIPSDECITNARGLPLAVDPSNPAYEKRLRGSVRRMLSADGYDADGLKIDFSARIPSGPGICTSGDLWGLELMKRLLSIIYDESKKTKPDALIITHTAHPYLSDVVDMIRLNDTNTGKNTIGAMTHRARVAQIACPDALIDTDNWPITDKATWREYTRLQPRFGVPSLYFASGIDSTLESFNGDDYRLIRETWARYRSGLAKEKKE